jgi:hypothetical protein
MISFSLDFDTEYQLLLYFLTNNTGVSPAERALQYYIPDNVFNSVKKDITDNEKVLLTFLKNRYENLGRDLYDVLRHVSAIDYNPYMEKMAKIFGLPMPDVHITITTNHAGTSDWYGKNEFCLRYELYTMGGETKFSHYLVWEMALAQTFQFIRNNHKADSLSDMPHIWGIAEISAWIISEYSNEFNFAPHEIQYPQLRKYKNDAITLWNNKKDFDDFATRLVALFVSNPV